MCLCDPNNPYPPPAPEPTPPGTNPQRALAVLRSITSQLPSALADLSGVLAVDPLAGALIRTFTPALPELVAQLEGMIGRVPGPEIDRWLFTVAAFAVNTMSDDERARTYLYQYADTEI